MLPPAVWLCNQSYSVWLGKGLGAWNFDPHIQSYIGWCTWTEHWPSGVPCSHKFWKGIEVTSIIEKMKDEDDHWNLDLKHPECYWMHLYKMSWLLWCLKSWMLLVDEKHSAWNTLIQLLDSAQPSHASPSHNYRDLSVQSICLVDSMNICLSYMWTFICSIWRKLRLKEIHGMFMFAVLSLSCTTNWWEPCWAICIELQSTITHPLPW